MKNHFSSFQGKKVLVTGHTGFKGSWLTAWLLSLGAKVTGIALPPTKDQKLFHQLGIEDSITHVAADIRNGEQLSAAIADCEPDYVFHLAAQSLVRQSYDDPLGTYQTNLLGTVNVLEALRSLKDLYRRRGKICSVVIVTTDKCYENKEKVQGYREVDPLGGYDPYSASKACAEIATNSYRQSFFNTGGDVLPSFGIASARAGNVIGGGDWAKDRIIPDAIKSLAAGEPINVRNPSATRPWQHVLEPLSGYMSLAAKIYHALENKDEVFLHRFCSAYNFGPESSANRNVRDLVEVCLAHWEGSWINASEGSAPHEAALLSLVWDKAHSDIGWAPVWSFETAVEKTINWYKQDHEETGSAKTLVSEDIISYMANLDES